MNHMVLWIPWNSDYAYDHLWVRRDQMNHMVWAKEDKSLQSVYRRNCTTNNQGGFHGYATPPNNTDGHQEQWYLHNWTGLATGLADSNGPLPDDFLQQRWSGNANQYQHQQSRESANYQKYPSCNSSYVPPNLSQCTGALRNYAKKQMASGKELADRQRNCATGKYANVITIWRPKGFTTDHYDRSRSHFALRYNDTNTHNNSYINYRCKRNQLRKFFIFNDLPEACSFLVNLPCSSKPFFLGSQQFHKNTTEQHPNANHLPAPKRYTI